MRPVAKPVPHDAMQWKNPIRLLPGKARPYLGGLPWGRESGTLVAEEDLNVLRKFYCEKREQYPRNRDELKAFLISPDTFLLVVWGEVGIGKTWFLRHELLIGDYSVETGDIHAGIIDLLFGWPDNVTKSAYCHLCPILDQYYAKIGSSSVQAMKAYREHQLVSRGFDPETLPEPDEDEELSRWLLLDHSEERADKLLRALEVVSGPPLFVVMDNIDKASDEDQDLLIRLATRMFRSQRIRLILPLRRTSRLIGDRFAELHEHNFTEMHLTRLEYRGMLKLRFRFSRAGTDLRDVPPIRDDEGSTYNFPSIYELMFESDVGKMLDDVASDDARVILKLSKQAIESDQLKALRNLSDPQHVLAALMLSDEGKVEPKSPFLLNLFDSEEPETVSIGYSLIRYRVLEFLVERDEIDMSEVFPQEYFMRIGFTDIRVKRVLLSFLRASLVYSRRAYVPQTIENRLHEGIGAFVVTRTGRAYWETLLSMKWYYEIVARATRVPKTIIRTQELDEPPHEREYVTHTDFIDWLREEEDAERVRIEHWEYSHTRLSVTLSQPHVVMRQTLKLPTN